MKQWYESIVFIQGDDFNEPDRLLHESDVESVFHYLNQWDYGEHTTITEYKPWGLDDTLYHYGQYVISYNWNCQYISLTRILDESEYNMIVKA